MRIGEIDINPAKNPAILDTAMWDVESASRIALTVGSADWRAMRDALIAGCTHTHTLPSSGQINPCAGSAAQRGGRVYFLATLADGQQAFIEIGAPPGEPALGAPVVTRPLGDDRVAAYRTDAATIDQYTQVIRPDKAPRALGATPRLGIGVRMTAAMWPAIYKAMDRGRFAANSIQNSVRELELLENILAARAPEAIYCPGFGTVASGHTGSTFEGLWTYGVLEALKSDGNFRYGADADHIKVAPGQDGLAWAKHVLDVARYYTFFTLDVSAVLDYGAMAAGSSAAEDCLRSRIPSVGERAAVSAYHRQMRKIGTLAYRLNEAMLGRLVGKYWEALDATQALAEHIRQFKGGRPFDLELAIDERTPDISTCACITTDDEVAFVLLELRRRGIPVTHLAPNFGVEKSVDYRCPDGLAGLAARVRSQCQIAEEFGVLLDFHSGDDLSSETRHVIGRATRGRNHFKISPMPQIIFAETVRDLVPELFHRWWNDALAYAEREAAGGSDFAATCIAEFQSAQAAPSPHDSIFHDFGFAFVGKRGPSGQYLNRESLYDLGRVFYSEYQSRITDYLCGLAEDLFNTSG